MQRQNHYRCGGYYHDQSCRFDRVKLPYERRIRGWCAGMSNISLQWPLSLSWPGAFVSFVRQIIQHKHQQCHYLTITISCHQSQIFIFHSIMMTIMATIITIQMTQSSSPWSSELSSHEWSVEECLVLRELLFLSDHPLLTRHCLIHATIIHSYIANISPASNTLNMLFHCKYL